MNFFYLLGIATVSMPTNGWKGHNKCIESWRNGTNFNYFIYSLRSNIYFLIVLTFLDNSPSILWFLNIIQSVNWKTCQSVLWSRSILVTLCIIGHKHMSATTNIIPTVHSFQMSVTGIFYIFPPHFSLCSLPYCVIATVLNFSLEVTYYKRLL